MALYVDENGILQPLGLKVIRDNMHEVIPRLRTYTDEIPGRDGQVRHETELKSRILKMTVGRNVSMTIGDPDYWTTVRDNIAVTLDPLNGEQSLTHAHYPGRVFIGVFGPVDIPRERGYMEFEVTFEMDDPYILGDTQKSLTGSGTATNAGTKAAPFTLTIQGPVTNPSVTVAGYTMAYTGTIALGSALVIDTGNMTGVLDGANALPNFNGVFPRLQPGDNIVTAATAGITTLNWFDRWI